MTTHFAVPNHLRRARDWLRRWQREGEMVCCFATVYRFEGARSLHLLRRGIGGRLYLPHFLGALGALAVHFPRGSPRANVRRRGVPRLSESWLDNGQAWIDLPEVMWVSRHDSLESAREGCDENICDGSFRHHGSPTAELVFTTHAI